MIRLRLSLGVLFALVSLLAFAGPVSAECFPQPHPFPPLSYAFTATVTEASDDVAEPLPSMAPFNQHLEMQVARVYRGSVPERVEANGWDVGCDFSGIQTRLGDRLFIATSALDPGDPRLILGHVLVWRSVGDGRWEAYTEALHDAALGYPRAALDADTVEEILRVVDGVRAPDTSTLEAPRPSAASGSPLLAAVFLVLLAFAVSGWLGRRSPAKRH